MGPLSRPNQRRSIGGEDNLAERIAYERELLGLSYEALAKKMTAAGCSIQGSAIFKIEKGNPRRRVTVDELIALSQVFDQSVEDLLTPMAVLKQAWAEQRVKDLDEAESRLWDAMSHLGDVWMDVHRHGLLDVIDEVVEEESVITYLNNRRSDAANVPDGMVSPIEKVFRVMTEFIQRTAAEMVVSEANEYYEAEVVKVSEEI